MKRATRRLESSNASEAPARRHRPRQETKAWDQLSRSLLDKLQGKSWLEGLGPVESALTFSTLFLHQGGPLVWVVPSNTAAEEIGNNLSFFLGPGSESDIIILPALESGPYRGLSPHPGLAARRAVALSRVAKDFQGILVTPIQSLISRTLPPKELRRRCTTLSLGTTIPREELIQTLRSVGYVREDPVSDLGEFSFRGGIVDVYSPSLDYPVRLEFFGDEIESIRKFDPSTQRSVGLISDVEIVPMREITPSASEVAEWHEKATAYWGEVRFADALGEFLQFTENEELFNGFEFLFPLVLPLEAGILDFFSPQQKRELRLILDEPEQLFGVVDQLWSIALESFQDCRLNGTPALPPEVFYFRRRELEQLIDAHQALRVEKLASDSDRSEYFDFQPTPSYRGRIQDVLSDANRARSEGKRTVYVMASEGMADRLVQIFHEYDLEIDRVGPSFQKALNHPVSVMSGQISSGFSSTGLQLQLITETDVFGEQKLRKPAARRRGEALGAFISDFRDLHEGDYVVHIDHGIGLFKGLRQIGVDRQDSEFVIIEYLGGSKLYVPIDRLDLIQKYSSGGSAVPPIDRLGGTSWKKTKTRIRKSMRSLAEDLLKLYAKRQIARGYAFSPDDEMMREFAEAFPYDETPDQIAAIKACREDQESQRPMDRLICGDVGYGKTEVAMRAIFKAVNDSKQVGVLAPTTVLAFQHFNTFQERFKGFPVNIEMLSRFLTREDQRRVIEKTSQGLTDVIVGTHRLLSKDVEFADLGLIIVDEEQRFGVAQKERLKRLKAQVDVLTLSATPIPRTLNMSLVGIRDLSIIETPPKDRLAIQTVVVKFSRQIIRSAIDLELKRNGQAFFVHNSVETIHSMAQLIQETIPEARVAVAHGQMREEMLEEVMLDFLSYRFDVLVCTTIIENGLDIPRSNTIIVNHADRFGLSQLYQLRGRVGRSNRRAYAYLLVSGEEVLTEDARRRLAAIKEFSDLGSGFRLAALDLEIRGAGNLLGGEQSGHIEAVGFELYVKLLEDSIRELKGEPETEPLRTSIDLRLDIQIPEHYIDDPNIRLWLYKRLSTANAKEKLSQLQDEIVDRFGKYPRAVANLLDYARLRLEAEELKLTAIERKGALIYFRFREDTPVSAERAVELVETQPGLGFSKDGSLIASIEGVTAFSSLARAFEILDLLKA